jgi:type I restriction enzyme S subunit
MGWPQIDLREVLQPDFVSIRVNPAETYEMVGVYSFGRGLFRKEPVHGSNTSYKFFYQLKSDHFVMSQLFGWEGALALSSPEFAGLYVSPQFPTFQCDQRRLNRCFLGWLARMPSFWEDLATRTRGMGDRRRTLNPEALLSCKIPLPPLDEQRRIVARVEELAAKLAEATRLQEEITNQMDALCRAMITNPSDGVLTPTVINELLVMRGPDVKVEPTESYHFAGVYCFGRGVFAGQRKDGSEFAYRSLTRIQEGNFLYPKLMAWEGALGVVPENCDGLYVSPEFPVFEVRQDRVLPEVLDTYFRMPSVWPDLAAISTGTNVRRRRLHPSAFLQYKFPLPSMNVQRQFYAVRRGVEQAKLVKSASTAELDSLMPAILSKAFRGEL